MLLFFVCSLQAHAFDRVQLHVTTAEGNSISFNCEVAQTPKQLARGLMFRKKLPENNGMLFVFDKADEQLFWMKNTAIPLDIIFIRADKKVHHIAQNTVPYSKKVISSRGAIKYVLEINAGLSKEHSIIVGSQVDWKALID
ncbi:DUF192 domain-containing protein [Polycladidibacter stylochi]|uniref:DUF192 domain-containing protein n=1 Tax=Polycladidibacter stylochi TaxID=1807766 RepID=UPI00082B6E28|nr:DUF192 domain-containing protein [Pseudovibrio stylochi]